METSPGQAQGGASTLEALSNGRLNQEAPISSTASPASACSQSSLPSPLLLLACKVSPEKSSDSLTVLPLYVTVCFSLAALKFLFIFDFCHFNYCEYWYGHPWVHLIWGSLYTLKLDVYFLLKLRKFSHCIISNKFFALLPLFFFRNPYNLGTSCCHRDTLTYPNIVFVFFFFLQSRLVFFPLLFHTIDLSSCIL